MSNWTVDDLKAKGFDKDGNKSARSSIVVRSTNGNSLFDVSGAIFIPMNVPSSKNSRRLFIDTSGVQRNIMSALCTKYIKHTKPYWQGENLKHWRVLTEGVRLPYRIEFTFVRATKQIFDFQNAIQILADLMTKNDWIKDDDVNHFLPYPPRVAPYVIYDKENVGVFIKILK